MSKIARITHDKKLLLADEIVEDNTKIRLDSDGRLDIDEIIEYPAELEGGRNLVIRKDELENHWIPLNGSVSPCGDKYVNAAMKDYIKVKPGEVLTFTKTDSTATDGGYWRWRWFDRDGNYISRQPNINNEFQWVVPSNTYFIQVSYPMDASPKIAKGNKATPWTPAPEDLGLSYSDDIDSFGTKLFEGRLMVSELIEDCSFGNILDFGEILEGEINIRGITIDGARSSDIADIPSDLFPLYYDGWHEFYDYDPPIDSLFPMFTIQYNTETEDYVSHDFIKYNDDGLMEEDRLFEYDNSYHNYRIIIGFPLMIQTVGVKGEFVLRRGSATGEILYKQYYDVTVGREGGCYLTTAMVGYFNKADDGIELTAMRKLRSHSGYKYQDVLAEYYQASPIIIRGIEQSEDKDYYYNMIKDVVDNIVVWVADEEWEKAETAYLDLYYYLKERFEVV